MMCVYFVCVCVCVLVAQLCLTVTYELCFNTHVKFISPTNLFKKNLTNHKFCFSLLLNELISVVF